MKELMRKFTSDKKVYYVLGIIVFLGIWEVLSILIGQRTMILPGPFESINNAFYQLGKTYTLQSIGASLFRLCVGYLSALLLGLVLGVLAGNDERVYYILKPMMTFLRSVPTASLVYLFIVLAGFKMAPVLLVVILSFPILYEAFAVSISNVSGDFVKASRLDGAGYLKENLYIKLPLASKYYLKNVFSTFSLAFKTEIMAEVLTGSSSKGLGNLIQGARALDPTNMLPVFGYSLIAVGLMLLVDFISHLLIRRIDV